MCRRKKNAAIKKTRKTFSGNRTKNLRRKLMKCYILSTALLGTETWTLRELNRNILKYVTKDAEDNCWTITMSQGGYCSRTFLVESS
jgi:hypothetical protein